MEKQIHAGEAEVLRIEGLFSQPDFFRKHGPRLQQLTAERDAAKETVARLYARWEELEQIKALAQKLHLAPSAQHLDLYQGVTMSPVFPIPRSISICTRRS